MALEWEEDADEDDNTAYIVYSNVGGEDGAFVYRLTPYLFGNKIVWGVGKSDPEILDGADRDRRFDSLDSAKAFCQENEDRQLAQYEAENRITGPVEPY